MPTNFRHVTFLCILFVQLATYYALPTTSVPTSLISKEGSVQPRARVNSLVKEIVELEGNNYTAILLNEQGYYSRSFKLEPAFKYTEGEQIPAILKRVSEPMSEGDSEKMGSMTHQEIGYLKRKTVGLYLFHQWSPSKNKKGLYDVDIIVEDIGEADPPFKPIHTWYKEDPSIIAEVALFHARGHIQEKLLWYANNDRVLYRDHTVRNIFLRKAALVQTTDAKRDSIEGAVMPIDWGPQRRYAGVIDVANVDDAERHIEEYSDTLHRTLQDNFSIEQLTYQLWDRNDDLRRDDYYWDTYFDKNHPGGVKCRHVLVETAVPENYGQQVWIYKVIDGVVQDGDEKPIKKYDGYLGKSALLRIGKIGLESEESFRDLQQRGLVLHMEQDPEEEEVYLLYRDTRQLLDEPKQKKQWMEWETVEYANADSETVQS